MQYSIALHINVARNYFLNSMFIVAIKFKVIQTTLSWVKMFEGQSEKIIILFLTFIGLRYIYTG